MSLEWSANLAGAWIASTGESLMLSASSLMLECAARASTLLWKSHELACRGCWRRCSPSNARITLQGS
jgi:hypothetical protein